MGSTSTENESEQPEEQPETGNTIPRKVWRKVPKTAAQRSKEYRQRLKAKNEADPNFSAKVPKTSAQRSKEYRQRMRAKIDEAIAEGILQKPVPKLPAQRSKEYRERLKARRNESNSNFAMEVKKGRPSKKQGVRILPKTSAQRQREYRERMKEQKEQKEANLNGFFSTEKTNSFPQVTKFQEKLKALNQNSELDELIGFPTKHSIFSSVLS